jgi:hypothetical protein
MEHEVSLLCSQQPMTGSCPDTDEFSPYSKYVSVKSALILLSHLYVVVTSRQVFDLNMQVFSTVQAACPTRSVLLAHPSLRKEQIMKLFNMQFPPFSPYYLLVQRLLPEPNEN